MNGETLNSERLSSDLPLTDAQFASLCRAERVEGFLRLRELLPSDLAAAKALRAEAAFVDSAEYRALQLPEDQSGFARKVRLYLIENAMDWNSDNLLFAAKRVLGTGSDS